MSVLPDQNHDSELDRVASVAGEIRGMVRQQDGETVANDLAALLHRTAQSSVQEIDAVMAQLKLLRDQLERDGAHAQRHLADYATLVQSALETTETHFRVATKQFLQTPGLRIAQ